MIGPALVLAAALASAQDASNGDQAATQDDAVSTQATAHSDADWIELVRTAQGDDYGPALQGAFARFKDRVDAYEMQPAEALMRAMHECAHGDWSAEGLSLVLARQGRYDASREVLAEQRERTDDPAARAVLTQAMALRALGAGRDDVARRELGAAYAAGNDDAGVVLALLALSAGRRDRTRAVSRALVADEPRPAWALRAWGLSMLPPSDGNPAR